MDDIFNKAERNIRKKEEQLTALIEKHQERLVKKDKGILQAEKARSKIVSNEVRFEEDFASQVEEMRPPDTVSEFRSMELQSHFPESHEIRFKNTNNQSTVIFNNSFAEVFDLVRYKEVV